MKVKDLISKLLEMPMDAEVFISDPTPLVTPQPKTGHWIKVHPLQAYDGGAYMCSCCEIGDWDLKGTEKFCPNCGAKMVEPQESEEQI